VLLSVAISSVSRKGLSNGDLKNMNKIVLLSLSLGALSCAAMADNVQLQRSDDTAATPNRTIPERQLAPADAEKGRFGAALDQSIGQRSGSVSDPSGRFKVQVTPDGEGSVVHLLSAQDGKSIREWKIGSGAGNLVVVATITEIMAATGQTNAGELSTALEVQPFSGKLKP
jgi:hypothetical protein